MPRRSRRPRPPQGPVAAAKSKNVADVPHAWADERVAVEYMERQRWGETPACPRCGDTDVYQMRDEATGQRSKRWLWRCRGCKQQYTVRVGTIMEDSAIPLSHWCFAFAAACASKKGISALQVQRMTGVSYKSALFMMHRIRWAMGGGIGGGKLSGIVEVDETYVGGKKRKGQRRVGRPSPKDKAPVVALVERGGEVRVSHVTDVTAWTLRSTVREHVARHTRVMTDEFNCYQRLPRDGYAHETVCHSAGEYARGDVHTNTVEGFFAIVKRGLYGTFHAVSRKHLHRYLSEFEFRYNTRWFEDGHRIALAMQAADGRRLTYHQQVTG